MESQLRFDLQLRRDGTVRLLFCDLPPKPSGQPAEVILSRQLCQELVDKLSVLLAS